MYKKPQYVLRTSIPIVVRSRLQVVSLETLPPLSTVRMLYMCHDKNKVSFLSATLSGRHVRRICCTCLARSRNLLMIETHFICVCVDERWPGPGRPVSQKKGENNFKLIHRHLAELLRCFWHLCRWQTLKYQLFSPRWEVGKMKLQSPE